MRKQSKRSLSLALTRAAADVLANGLASLKYGGRTTPGPRQTAILAQIAAAPRTRKGARRLPFDDIASAQGIGRNHTETALACLRARGLVRRHGNNFHLTARGAEAAARFTGIQIPAGVGLVLTGLAIR
jgi:hypothetical protein